MIAVIIVTKNHNYAVLEVPENGRLVIMERHLICGIVQNGVKMIPYGNILYPFETFIFDNTLSVEMIPAGVWRPEGRVLDFTNIELLQASETVHPSQSGSISDFQAPTYSEGGRPINYNLRVKGANFSSVQQAQDWLSGAYGGTVPGRINGLAGVNALSEKDGYQYLSAFDINPVMDRGLFDRSEFPITEFYDLQGSFTRMDLYTMNGPKLEIVEFPAVTDVTRTLWISASGAASLKLMKFPVLETIGAGLVNDNVFSHVPNNIEIQVPRSLETVNAGALEGDLQYFKDTKFGVVTFLD